MPQVLIGIFGSQVFQGFICGALLLLIGHWFISRRERIHSVVLPLLDSYVHLLGALGKDLVRAKAQLGEIETMPRWCEEVYKSDDRSTPDKKVQDIVAREQQEILEWKKRMSSLDAERLQLLRTLFSCELRIKLFEKDSSLREMVGKMRDLQPFIFSVADYRKDVNDLKEQIETYKIQIDCLSARVHKKYAMRI